MTTTNLKNSILTISNEILNYLLEYKASNVDFTFSLRTRDSVTSSEERLSQGQWFQGSDYIYVPLFKKGDADRKIKTIGFVLTFTKTGEIADNYIEISFKGGYFTRNEVEFHQELAAALGLDLNGNQFGAVKYAEPKAYLLNLKDFITSTRTKCMELLEKYSLTDLYVITETDFKKALDKALKIRQELMETEKSGALTKNQFTKNLNLILYGPPGTGKTYNTINRALEIIGIPTHGKSREDLKELFNEKVAQGFIVFTTFHQSMSYEDFIEGIKPLKPLTDDAFVKYDVQPGLFYKICEAAKSNFQNSRVENKEKVRFEEALDLLKDDWELDPEMKFPLKTEGYDFTIIGFTNTSIQFRKASGGTGHTLSIGTLKELYYGKEFNFKQGVGIYYPAVLNKIQSYKLEEASNARLNNYVLIIDEINRGNVSQIFGELITLLEEDKRLLNAESLEVVLPYSKEAFSVPPNLFVLGTMNTADRSVEALDTALRRRFSFIEMPPKPELLTPEKTLQRLWNKYEELTWEDKKWLEAEGDFLELYKGEILIQKEYRALENRNNLNIPETDFKDIVSFTGLSLEKLLRVLNLRIEKLLDKDHQIGHSYFMNVFSTEDLKQAFSKNIIPLLQEYFYGDYGKIGMILGEAFFEINTEEDVAFKPFFEYPGDELSEKPIYRLRNLDNMGNDEFLNAVNSIM